MTCRTCGTAIAEKALICYRCGTATADRRAAPPAPRPAASAWPVRLALVAGVLAAVALWWWLRQG